MKTYTFKIKVDFDKVVIAVNMQIEQFYDSVKLTNLNSLVEKYPEAYITASDYYVDDKFISRDYCICPLKTLLYSHDLKSFLLDPAFNGFFGDDYFSEDMSTAFIEKASKFMEEEKNIIECNEDGNAELLAKSLAETETDYDEDEEDEGY